MKEVAVVFAGSKFDLFHIKQIYMNLHEYCTNFRLTVFADRDDVGLPGVRVIRLPDWKLNHKQLWWYKVFMFSPQDWTGPVFYMDLDTIILSNIDKFWDYEVDKFCICQDFNRQFVSTYPVCNSSIMRFDNTKHHKLYNDFVENPQKIIRLYRGDQDYVTAYLKDSEDKMLWPKEWAMSYKWEILHGGSKVGGPELRYPEDYHYPEHEYIVPEECSIAVFHGKPDPYDTEFGQKRLTVL